MPTHLRYPVAILAGGLGTRMRHRTGPRLPKAMIPVAGRPFIDWKLRQLAEQGATRVVLLTGHGADELRDHVQDGSAFGLQVALLPDGQQLLGTGGAVRRALDSLGPAFWVTFGDNLLSVPMRQIEARFDADGPTGIMTVLENRDQWDLSNVAVREGLVVEYQKGAPPGTYDYIDYGMTLLDAVAFLRFRDRRELDLGDVLKSLVINSQLGAFIVKERFYEIGSEEGLAATQAHLLSLRGPAPSADG